MSLLIVYDTPKINQWTTALRAALPDLAIRVWPDVGDPASIRYVVAWRAPPGALADLPALQAVFVAGAGVERVLADPCVPRSVPVIRLIDPDMTDGMVEYVTFQVLRWHLSGDIYSAQQARSEWRPLTASLARDRTVGILGMGELGAAAARALGQLKFDVVGWSRGPKSLSGVATVHGADGLTTVLGRSQILVCLLPLTSDTARLLDSDRLATLPQGAVVINAGRGGLIVEDALLAALDRGHLGGATLDVFEEEPLPAGHPFWRHPKIVVTPHVASVTRPGSAVAAIAANIGRHRAGETMEGLVDRDRGY